MNLTKIINLLGYNKDIIIRSKLLSKPIKFKNKSQ